MDTHLFEDMPLVHVHAVYVGERIDIKPLDVAGRLATGPLLIRAGRTGCAAVFRYGATVLFGLDPVEEAAFLANLEHLVREPIPEPFREDATFRSSNDGDRIQANVIHLRHVTYERLQVIAVVLARSVALEFYESSMAQGFERVEPLAVSLKRYGSTRQRARELLRYIGEGLLTEHRMVSRLEVDEKPELLWEHPDLEPLYQRLEQEYELHDRRAVLERKQELLSRTVETVLDLLNHRRSLRVEWYIVALIVIEIGLTLYTMFIQGGH